MIKTWQKSLLPILLACSAHTSALANSDIDKFKQSWTAKGMQLQRTIDINTPLNQATFVGTHNSYNAKAYQIPFVRYVDPNQWLSLYDQLEMGVRSIEMDAHWTYKKNFSQDILLCHGLSSHLGCGPFDREFEDGLKEVRDWLKANPNEVIILYIERHLDGHEPRLAAELENYLGPYLYHPSTLRPATSNPTSCVSLPGTLTKADVLKAGKQILVVAKGCDGDNPKYAETDKFKQIWNNDVFAGMGNIPHEEFSFIDSTVGDFTSFPDCGRQKIFFNDTNHTTPWRIFEDLTILSNIESAPNKVTVDKMHELMHCGINLPTMDLLTANDDRLAATIWSWSPNYPQADKGQCAFYQGGASIENAACEQVMAGFACRDEHTGDIKAIKQPGTWKDGENFCQSFAGKTWHFSMPVNGLQMSYLKNGASVAGIANVWLNYSVDKQGNWTVNG